MQHPNRETVDSPQRSERRGFLEYGSGIAMAGGLASAYGTFGFMAARFLFPAAGQSEGWQFVAPTREFQVGEARPFVSPSGAKVVIARQSAEEQAEAFIALSSVCPHLGCQVHWEPHNERFFCPCHNGAFDPQGHPLQGPPAAAGQQLTRFPLRIEEGMLFVLAPLQLVTATQSA